MKEKLIEHEIISETKIRKNGLIKLERDVKLLNMVITETSFLQYNAPIKARVQCILKNIQQQPLCISCNAPLKMRLTGKYINTFPMFCGNKCSSSNQTVVKKRQNTNINKYGHTNVLQSKEKKEQISKTLHKKYGVDNVFKSNKIRQKIKETNLKKFGTENPSSNNQVKGKRENTNLERYGVNQCLKNEMIREQIEQTNIERYGIANPFYDQKKIRKAFKQKYNKDYPLQVSSIREKAQKTLKNKYGHEHYLTSNVLGSVKKLNDYNWVNNKYNVEKFSTQQIAQELNVAPSTVLKYLHYHQFEINLCSQVEQNFGLFLNTISKFERNNRNILYPKEIDFYDPTHKVAIEFNGIFWHSEKNGRDKHYHANKTANCNKQKIRLLHITDYEWLFQPEIVKSRIKSLYNLNQKIYARQCIVKKINSYQAAEFLINNHIQGNSFGFVNYGLYFKDDLVAVMSFCKSRYKKKYQYELLRFCNKININVVGGAGKLFNQFVKEFCPSTIISYADRRWNTGHLYSKLGFVFCHNSYPNYKYFKPSQPYNLFSRITFQKHKLKDKLDNFDPTLTEWENMKNHGYDRIWDCGNSVWLWKNKI